MRASESLQTKLYVLSNGKVIEALGGDKKDNVEVELRDHIKVFHENFFTLSPDNLAIQRSVTKALYLCDGSARKFYEDLKEAGYYSNIISGNISQSIELDSITTNIENYPCRFQCFAHVKIVRPTTTTIRSLITAGYVRNVARTDNNPHGYLIERWEVKENKDLRTENR